MYVLLRRKCKIFIPLSLAVFVLYMIGFFTVRVPIVNDNRVRDKNVVVASIDMPTNSSIETQHAPLYSDDVINPHLYDFTISNSDYCMNKGHSNKNDSEPPFLVILVKCSPGDAYDRQQIRQTWGGRRVVHDKVTLTGFLLGMSTKPEENEQVRNESEQYQDIIQENFIDSYRNLTLKTMMGMRWVSEFCRNVSYVVSADADVMLNTYNLVKRLKKKPREGYAEGSLRRKAGPVRDSDGHDNKWFTSYDMYPEPTYPPFFPGSCYVLSADVASTVFRESVHVRFLPWDDVFVGLAMKRAGIQPKSASGYAQYVKLKSDRSIKNALVRGIAVLINHQTDGVDSRLVNLWNSSVTISNEFTDKLLIYYLLVGSLIFIASLVGFCLLIVCILLSL